MDSDPTPNPRLRRTLLGGALAAAGLALAVPASGALAGSNSATTNGVTTDPGSTPGFVQDRERSGGRDKRDCPEDGRGESGRNEGSSGQGLDESQEL